MELSSPDTSLALMRAAQTRAQQASTMAEKSGEIKNIRQIEEAAKEFEAVFLTEMFKPMFENIKPNTLTGGGKGEQIFNGFLLQEYGQMLADKGGVGIAEHVKAELIRIQEEAKQ